jgi:glycine cleavage system H lipoate-binding protein
MVALFVIGTIILFLALDGVVILARRRREAAVPKAADIPLAVPDPRRMPAGMYLHPSHLWATVDPEGRVRLGFDELAQKLIGRIETARFLAKGMHVEKGETLFSVQVGSIEIPFASPVSGTVRETRVPDGEAGARPDAWLCTVEPDRLAEDIRPFRLAEEAGAWLGMEFQRLRESIHALRLRPAMAGALPDGGEPVEGLLKVLDSEGRDHLVRDFLVQKG